MNRSALASDTAPLRSRKPVDPLASEFERSVNQPIRELLRAFGLRSSLIRFKVINALLMAAREGRSIGVQGVHSYMESCSVDLSFISVREVLKRLSDEGLILLQADRNYRFTADAWATLKRLQ